jgi:CNT family concentrative nucleoside transporter
MFLQYFLEYNRYLNFIGIMIVLGIAYAFSNNRSRINLSTVGWAFAAQVLIAFFMLKTTIGQIIVGVCKIYLFADQGINFVFGNLANPQGSWGFIWGIKVLPIIIFFGALTSLLFHWGVIQWCVAIINRVLQPLLKTSGAETLVAVANSFLGPTEAPLLIRNYLKDLTKSELFVVMVSGMATISGSVLVVYAAWGVPAPHLLAASIMAVPAAIIFAKILVPETDEPKTMRGAEVVFERKSSNMFDAIAIGTMDGLSLALAVGAMLIAFVALFGMFNYILVGISCKLNCMFVYFGYAAVLPELSIDLIFSYIFSPFSYLLGFTGSDALAAGHLLGKKVAINEMFAFGDMVRMGLSERTVGVLTYALCGFANFSVIGILIGGVGALAPERRGWLTELGLKALLAGSLANLLSAMIASLLL